MTEKDYELIARVLREAYAVNVHARTTLAHDFANELAETNPRFDRERFIKAATSEMRKVKS